ncbi:MAG: tetratricopeptide repeat protein, partial [Bacteroidota bacterium]
MLTLPTQAQTPSDSALAEAHWEMAVCYVIEDSFEQSRHYWQACRIAMERGNMASLLARRTVDWVYEWQWSQDRDFLRGECQRSLGFQQPGEQPPDSSLLYELILMVGVLYREDGLFAQAEAWLLQAQVHASRLNDLTKQAAVKEELGIVNAIRGDRVLAQQLFEEALVLKKQALGDWHEEISFTENNLGVLATEMGDLPRAIRHLRRSLAIIRAQPEASLWEVAGGLANLGRTFFQLAYLDSARHYFQASLDHYREAGYGDDFHLTVPYTGLANVASDEGRFELSVAYYDSAREVIIQNQAPDYWEVGANYSNLGSLHLDWGQESKARAYLTQALAVYEKSELSLTSGLWGDLYLHLAQNSPSLYSEESMALVRKAIRSYRDRALNRELALAMLFHGFLHHQQLDSAQKYLNKRAEILNSYSEIPLPRALELHVDRGQVAELGGNFQEALGHYRSGLRLTQHPNFQSLEGYQAGQALSEYYSSQSQWDSALHYLILSQSILNPVSSPSNGTQPFQPFPRKMAALLRQEAQIRVKLWEQSPDQFTQLNLGLKAIKRALHLTDFELELNWDLPTQQKLGELVRSICAVGMALVHHKWEQAADRSVWEEAINISERAKAVQLYRGLAQWAAQQELSLPVDLREEDLRLRRAHIQVQQSLNEAQSLGIPDSNRWRALTQRWQDLGQARQALADQITRLHPPYAQLSYQRPQLTSQAIQASLKPQQGLVSYFQGKDQLYQLWLLDGELGFFKQDWSPEWSHRVQEFAQQKQGKEGPDIPGALAQKLVAPLQRASPAQRLLVIPDASLNYLPFEALPLPASEQPQDWLIKHYAIGYAPSLALWTAAPSIKLDAQVAYGGFAPNFEGAQQATAERTRAVGPLLWAP